MKDLFEYIERYYAHKLTKRELEEFEKKVKEDKEFRYEVKAYIAARKAVEMKADERLKNRLNRIGNEMFEKQIKKPAGKLIKLHRWSYIAAAVFIGIVSTVFIVYTAGNNRFSAGKIIAEYYAKPDPKAYVTRDVSLHADRIDLLWDSALSEINKQQYNNALVVIDSLLQLKAGDTGPSTLYYFRGYCYFETQQFEKAIQAYSTIKPASRFYFDAQMNSSLAYLKTNDKTSAKKILVALIKSNAVSPDKKDNVAGLLKKIDKMK